MKLKTLLLTSLASATQINVACATEFHVATNGNDQAVGTRRHPFRTIQRAADLAQPGDVITVHEGVYRERINPPRGGESDTRRIVYRAAPREQVKIKGSEVIKNWVKMQDGVWKVVLPNSFFGGFNPYRDLIRGDWFSPKGREHHTGAVYLNGDWLVEAAKLEDVLQPPGLAPASQNQPDGEYLLNVAWLQPVTAAGSAGRISANRFAAQHGVQTAACSEGGECIGWIEQGDWVRYDAVDFGSGTERLEIRAASVTEGGLIEIRLGAPDGELLGTCTVTNTGDWQVWASFNARIKATSGRKNLCLVFKSRQSKPSGAAALNTSLWFAQVDAANTTIWAQFKGVNPNEQLVEINVRQTVFYPDQPGRNYLTVRGFTLQHAATPWAPPTAEQIGLIGTHWSKGWIIENNVVSHSICSGVALGKHGDPYDNTSANTAEGYVKTIERAHAFRIPWTRENIGHHIVRNNTISHCEQTGIVGSLGAAFCIVIGNHIHDIHVRRLFSGAEMAGIKFHAAIDTVIRSNHIHRTCRGLWLDWMAQGTRVSGNLFHENASEDLFLEVNHGPFLVDNNVFLSPTSVLDMSEGGAFAHNLFTGKINSRPELSRDTPYHPAHSTVVAGLANIKGGEHRYYNNLFVAQGENSGAGLWVYDAREMPLQTGGNVYCNGARPYARETGALLIPGPVARPELVADGNRVRLQLELAPQLKQATTARVTTGLLGKARIPNVGYENPDGSPLAVERDYLGRKRSVSKPVPGPFEGAKTGKVTLQVR